jgi:MFS family permease
MNFISAIKKKADFFNTQFFLLWQGQLVSKLGTYLFDIAVILWVKENSGSAGLISLILIAGSIPEIILAPIGGTLADIFSRRNILIYSDLFAGFAVIGFSMVILFNPFPVTINYIILIFTAAGLGISASCFNPSASALIPEFVGEQKLHSANALFQSTGELTMITGQGIGGVIFSLIGAPFMFLANGVSFLISAFSESFIRKDTKAGTELNLNSTLIKIKTDFIEGFHYCRKDVKLRYFLFVIGLYHFFIAPLPILLPFLVSDTLHLGNEWLGFLLAGFAGGTLAGFAAAGTMKISEERSSFFIIFLFFISSVLFITLGISSSVYVCLVSLFLLGSIIGMVVVTLITKIQKIAPNEMRGRLFGFLNTITNASMPVGLGIYGILSDILRRKIAPGFVPEIFFLINGCCIFIFMFIIIVKKAIEPQRRKDAEKIVS